MSNSLGNDMPQGGFTNGPKTPKTIIVGIIILGLIIAIIEIFVAVFSDK